MTSNNQKPEANARTGVTAVGSGDLLGGSANILYGLAACILAFFLGLSLLVWVAGIGESDGAALRGSDPNRTSLPNTNNNDTNPTQSKKQSWGSIDKLTSDSLGIYAEAGVTGDSENEKLVTKVNGKATNKDGECFEKMVCNPCDIRIQHGVSFNGCLVCHKRVEPPNEKS